MKLESEFSCWEISLSPPSISTVDAKILINSRNAGPGGKKADEGDAR